MKSFWQRSPKKSKKKKRNPKAVPSKQISQSFSKSSPAPWVPPYPAKLKVPVVENNLLVKSPVIYQIPPISDIAGEKSVFIPHLKEEMIYPKHQQARKDFLKTFRSLIRRRRSWDVWTDFVVIVACVISNSVDGAHYDEREKIYLSIIKKYEKQEQLIFAELYAHLVLALEENPEQDFLGDIYTELGLNEKEHKQIFTPYHVCRFMAELTMDDLVSQVEEKGVVEFHDCCCGSGATLIAASNEAKEKLKKANLNYQNHILVTGQDIDRIVTMMCYIQLSLLGVAGYFKVGNTFTEPMTDGDSLENYWFTPMYFFPVWHYRRIWHSMDRLFRTPKDMED